MALHVRHRTSCDVILMPECACSHLILNVLVPYKYGTHQCMEPQFHALKPHLSCTSCALPIRIPHTRAAVRIPTRIPMQDAIRRISRHLRAAVSRIYMLLEAGAPRISTQSEAVVWQILMTVQGKHSHAFRSNNKCGSVYYHYITNSRFQCCYGEL